jgi:hypothetical protein
METCFVIQPFDKDKFDKRYNDIFEPAIREAGLEPYRVDKDPSVRVPIQEIEEGIKSSRICLAEITLDNPNVWYELGYAFAMDKDVVMVTEERQKFPFDIQHRQVIHYKTGSPSDYTDLRKNITEKLIALMQTRKNVQLIIDTPVRESEGLEQYEVTMLLLLFENQISDDDDRVSASYLQKNMERAGYTKNAANIAFRELKNKGYIEQKREYSEDDGERYEVFKLTENGVSWILKNKDKVVLRKTPAQTVIKEDDLPF